MMRLFNVGDKVNIINGGERYSGYIDWFIEHIDKLKPEWLIQYAYSAEEGPCEYDCEIIFADYEHDKYLIMEPEPYSKVYLVNHKAFCKQMTLTQIEKELGYRIELVPR